VNRERLFCEYRPVAAAYRFLDRWVIPAPIEQVYDAIGDPLGYEDWWTDFVLEARGDAGPPTPGKRNELLVKAYLPYKVNFGLEVLEANARVASCRGSRGISTVQACGHSRRRATAPRRPSTGGRWSTTR
jgi:hypothetical protein